MPPKHVYIYMQNWLPERNGDGTSCGIYSDVRAYHDLGYQVEVVSFQTRPGTKSDVSIDLEGVNIQVIAAQPAQRHNPAQRAAYLAGWPFWPGSQYHFKTAAQIRRAVQERQARHPHALHQFEYLDTACVLSGLPPFQSIWRLHDIETNFLREHRRIRRELENRAPTLSERCSLRFMQRLERELARRAALVLCYARHEQQVLRQDWGCTAAELLPVSWPDETPVARGRGWGETGHLRLLHIGRIDSLPSFRSLEFILREVFPLLDPPELEQISVQIIGKINDTERARAIQRLAQNYPQVLLLDYQEDLKPWYSGADLQLVGSTHATGLRTRVIESWAWGVPVLSTSAGAQGIEGLRPGENILLADSPQDFAACIRRVLAQPSLLAEVAHNARATYDQIFSRAAVAVTLSNLLLRNFP